jgi:hypothetical protein
MSASKSDRSTSPAATEDSRRDLLARQHRALYGNESPAFFPPGPLDDNSRPDSQTGNTGVRGSSPRAVDPFGLASTESIPSPSRANSTSSPSSAAAFEQPAASTPPSDSPSRSKSGSVGPIGSRVQQSAPPTNPALNKRSITPLPSPLGLGFTADPSPTERTSSAGPAPAAAATGSKDSAGGVGLGWSNGSGVWGSKSGLGVQASVWG